jgi:hypothetical protein
VPPADTSDFADISPRDGLHRQLPPCYATYFLYNQRRPSWRRQTCPRTSRPVMLRLGMMTRRRCQVVGLAGRRLNPSFRMSMAVKLIDGMVTPFGSICPRQARPAADILAPHRLSRSSPLLRP